MPNIALFAGGDLSRLTSQPNFDLYVGVDRGCLFLLENELPLDWAVGDFDSVTDTEFEKIKAAAGKIHQSPAEKDDTDTELALKVVFEKYPNADVTIFGAFGGRIDHFLSNIFLPSEPALARFMKQIHLLDVQNQMSYLPAGKHRIFPKNAYKYVSFMLEGQGELVITGAKYELSASNFFPKKIYSSNEFTNNPIEVTVPSGYLIVLYTRDRS
ncbi:MULTISPECIES: thiamine diphosphokinase [Streptococcus]|uniref:Thiamine diphosphokinase n=1 Tax=Streptococcus caledonicus TaxID=2614158 RepID=A0ABW0UIJ4_9STRE|nr:thiamine diphosphokinase [Streptococcus sp. S784/96/1]